MAGSSFEDGGWASWRPAPKRPEELDWRPKRREDYLSTRDVAQRLALSVGTVLNMVRRGAFGECRSGPAGSRLIPLSGLEAYERSRE